MRPYFLRLMAVLVAAATFVVLAGAFTHPGVPRSERGLLVAFAITAAWRPRAALLGITAAIPLGFLGSAAPGEPFRLTEALVLSCLAGWSIRAAATRRRDRAIPPDLLSPLVVLAIVIIASAVVIFAGVRAVNPLAFRADVVASLARDYLFARGPLQPGEQAFFQLESVALFAAAAAASCTAPGAVSGFTRVLVAGAAGAAALNVVRLLEIALRSGTFWPYLGAGFRSVRINIGYGDVNAAGSYFALAAVVAAGVTLMARGRWRIAAGAMAILIFAAAWLTGSRAAVGAILLVLGGLLVLNLRSRATRRHAVVGLAMCGLVGAVFVVFFPNPVGGAGESVALLVRKEMGLISLRMLRDHPWFGIGVGQFYQASGPFLQQSRIGVYYAHENAHNNVLQVLAETGFAGAGAVTWLVVAGFRRVRLALRMSSPGENTFALRTLVAALSACAATMLLGHPLLTPEVSFTFALAAGTAAGFPPGVPQPEGRSRRGMYAAAAVALLLLSLPIRVRQQIAEANMDHVGWGVGRWETDPAGERFRRMSGPAVLFVPAKAAWIELPYRLAEAGPPVVLSIAYRGRPADEVVVRSTAWTRYRMRVPPADGPARYQPLQLTPRGGGAANVLLGKIIDY